MGRIVMLGFAFCFAGSAGAQVINGESTDDAAYAPRPAARWQSPEAGRVQPDAQAPEDLRVEGSRLPPRRD